MRQTIRNVQLDLDDTPVWFVTGVDEVPTIVHAGSWLTALAAALDEHGLAHAITRLTIERRGKRSAIATDARTGRQFEVQAAS